MGFGKWTLQFYCVCLSQKQQTAQWRLCVVENVWCAWCAHKYLYKKTFAVYDTMCVWEKICVCSLQRLTCQVVMCEPLVSLGCLSNMCLSAGSLPQPSKTSLLLLKKPSYGFKMLITSVHYQATHNVRPSNNSFQSSSNAFAVVRRGDGKISRGGGNNDALNTDSSSLLRNGAKSCQQLDISFQRKYMEQSIFARVNNFCPGYMCVTRAVHACDDKVTGAGCWLEGWMCVCVSVCVVSFGEKKGDHRSRVVYTVASHFPLWFCQTCSWRNMTDIHAHTHFKLQPHTARTCTSITTQ